MNERFARSGQLLVIYLKRDWKKIAVWILFLGLFGGAFVPAFEEITAGQGLVGMFHTLNNPVMTTMVGITPIDVAENYTLGAMYSHTMLLFTGLFSAIISGLHVVSHTREAEDSGITELVSSFRVGRQANSLAVMLEILIINSLLALFIALTMISFGIDSINMEGSFLFAISIGMAGLLGAVISLVMAQIMPTSGGATGSTLGIIGMFYLVRGMTDIMNPSWTLSNPMGWIYLTYPFTENNWNLLALSASFSIVLLFLAFILEEKRDIGSGYLYQSTGRARASKPLLSIPGVFLRLTRAMIISWLVAFSLMGLAYGSIYGDLQTFVESNEIISQMFQAENTSIEASFTAIIMVVLIGLVAILPIALINKLFNEEKSLHLNQIFATKVSRFNIYWTTVAVAILIGMIGIFLSASSLGLAATMTMATTEAFSMNDFILAGFSQAPVVFFFIGLTGLTLGLLPKFGKYIYLYLAHSFLVVYLQDLLNFPTWLANTSIQTWLPQLPVDEFNLTIFITIIIISIVMMLIGYYGYQRRDLVEEY